MNKLVKDINEYLAEVSKSNNECTKKSGLDLPLEWMQVRMAALIPHDVYMGKYIDKYGEDLYKSELLPEGTTHVLVVGIQHWDSSQPDVLCCMSGQEFWVRECKDGSMDMEDIDDCLGGGPDLQDSSMDECIDWIHELGGEQVTMYYDLVNEFGTEIPLPDSGYPKGFDRTE